ncbi:hypothetical protein [Domibacillus robiginosus]|uniref:hypothetical protein n=1 Tax=Domibacillus robiginosus TaxID=1071054 RepID=UPI00067CC73B|nr:hypothetical protein [Domibacillus robiginosus]
MKKRRKKKKTVPFCLYAMAVTVSVVGSKLVFENFTEVRDLIFVISATLFAVYFTTKAAE